MGAFGRLAALNWLTSSIIHHGLNLRILNINCSISNDTEDVIHSLNFSIAITTYPIAVNFTQSGIRASKASSFIISGSFQPR